MQTTFPVQSLDIAAVVERKCFTGLMVKKIFDSFLAGLAPALTHYRMSDWFRSIQTCNDYPSATTYRTPVRHNALHTTRGNAVLQPTTWRNYRLLYRPVIIQIVVSTMVYVTPRMWPHRRNSCPLYENDISR